MIRSLLHINALKILGLIFLLSGNRNGHCQEIRSLLPDYAKLQYAGSIGFLSGAVGYHFLKEHIEAEAGYGYVPRSFGGPLHIAHVKTGYSPVKVNLGQAMTLTPLFINAFITYHFGDEYYIVLPDHYPAEYYKWSSAIRYHAGMGSMLRLNSSSKPYRISLYYEVNTNDIYLRSLKENKSLTLYDMIALGFGIKLSY